MYDSRKCTTFMQQFTARIMFEFDRGHPVVRWYNVYEQHRL
jgi:hypothetical protein